jgi:hypothetical protein
VSDVYDDFAGPYAFDLSDAQIGLNRVPSERVIGDEWIYPNDIALYGADVERVEAQAAE